MIHNIAYNITTINFLHYPYISIDYCHSIVELYRISNNWHWSNEIYSSKISIEIIVILIFHFFDTLNFETRVLVWDKKKKKKKEILIHLHKNNKTSQLIFFFESVIRENSIDSNFTFDHHNKKSNSWCDLIFFFVCWKHSKTTVFIQSSNDLSDYQ